MSVFPWRRDKAKTAGPDGVGAEPGRDAPTLAAEDGRITAIRVESWTELQERLFEGAWNADLGRHRAPLAYRGTDAPYPDLRTSLARLGEEFREVERHLLRTFAKYASPEVGGARSFWDVLALAQHHGLPTRLLDWTYSPYVALHFATANMERFDEDGTIWCVDYGRTNALLPDRLRQALEEEGAQAFTAGMLADIVDGLDELDELSTDPYLVFFEPPSLDARIVNQYALFSLMSDPGAQAEEWLASHGSNDLARRLVIPAELKWEVRDKLDQANITERVLFPGLDGLCRWLHRYYSPRR